MANVLTTIAEPSIEAAEQIFHHPKVALLCVTGGAAVAKAAAKSGKRVIAGGPGNPPVVVDETADLDRAAQCIIDGAAFDNNLLCIGEKEVFVVASVADAFIAAMQRAGAFELDAAAIDRLTKAAFTFEGGGGGCARAHVKKDLVGKDVAVLAAAAGVRVPAGTDCCLARPMRTIPSLQEEQMMPFVPVVRVQRCGCGHCGLGQGRARLPAHGHHSHAKCGDGNAHGARHEHHAFHSERRLAGLARRRRPGIFQPHHCHSDRRRNHHAAHLHARAADGGRQCIADYLVMFLGAH